MTLDDHLQSYRDSHPLPCDEAHLNATVRVARHAFLQAEATRPLPWRHFLLMQAHLIRKRWWLGQLALLLILASALPSMAYTTTSLRLLSASATAFVLLLLPELWRNHQTHSLEVESAAYFSLRQILAARLLLFGIIDVALLTLFCLYATRSQLLSLTALVVHFLLPLTLTATLCLACLSSRHLHSVFATLALCLPLGTLWSLLLASRTLYERLAPSLWGTLLIASLLLLITFTQCALRRCTTLWEGSSHGTFNHPSY